MTDNLTDEPLDVETRAFVDELTKELEENPPLKCPVTFDWSGDRDLAQKVGLQIQIYASLMRRRHPWMCFEALDSIVFHHDYHQALQDVSQRAGRPCQPTIEASGVGVAMVVHLDEKCVMVLDAGIALGIAQTEDEGQKSLCIDLVMHELCHVHDHDRKRRLLGHEFMRRKIEGLDFHTFTAAESAWCEFFANRYCTSDLSSPDSHPKYLAEVVPVAVSEVKSAIREYRLHGRLDDVVAVAQQKVKFIFQCFGYAAGRLVANGASLGDVAPESVDALEAARLSDIWSGAVVELQRLDSCRDSWTSFDVLKPLMDLVLQAYAILGMHYTIKDGQVWVDIPYSTDTMPGKAC